MEEEEEGSDRSDLPASVQIPLTSAPLQLPIFSANDRRLIPRWRDICVRTPAQSAYVSTCRTRGEEAN